MIKEGGATNTDEEAKLYHVDDDGRITGYNMDAVRKASGRYSSRDEAYMTLAAK